ncbi:hypothetical protein L1987_60169 [Smallanthus sonchifolius]|uniref:Uncharacterized protein n=1 Tax=Smallanthus sonchifolius TaxID=185202 RepID=A0ACB9D7H1_9ASTR|nr:hypothetical protein L1987_60169 [Smallanthus sonchifolius]
MWPETRKFRAQNSAQGSNSPGLQTSEMRKLLIFIEQGRHDRARWWLTDLLLSLALVLRGSTAGQTHGITRGHGGAKERLCLGFWLGAVVQDVGVTVPRVCKLGTTVPGMGTTVPPSQKP